tara:strand:+ start:730 stop:1083 length:354 start_codon:yes stop_codon:yes gene_type:complete
MNREDENINTAREDENSFDKLLNDCKIGDLIKLGVTETGKNVCEHLYSAPKSQFFYYCHLAAEQLADNELYGLDFTTEYDFERSVEAYTHQNQRNLVVKCTEPMRKCNCTTHREFSK